MTTLITNIRQLVGIRKQNKLLRGKELAELAIIENAYLLVEDGMIAEYGEMSSIRNSKFEIRNS